ncbi:aryl-alcohol dehydrogenase-like predicted oxidoreductase [Amphiplicatus metriothermophilus]|nr:aryl-alcohol dehydrogenase-like predicted oxidoreductase [Amphiplicatus metriothermophilus]
MRWFSARKAARLVAAAMESGVRHFDTAGFYGRGEAERRLGAALKEIGDPVFVSTKTGTRYRGLAPPEKDFSQAAIIADVEASLRRLQRERLDLLYLHGPSPEALAHAVPILERLRREGKIDRWGVCAQGEQEIARAVEAGAQAVMAAYNLFDRRHRQAFRSAKARGAGVVAISPLAQGLFARDFYRLRRPADAWRVARALARKHPQIERIRAGVAALEGVDDWTPAQLALVYALAEPCIDVALTTTTRLAHLRESVEAVSRTPPVEIIERLESLAPGLDGGGPRS